MSVRTCTHTPSWVWAVLTRYSGGGVLTALLLNGEALRLCVVCANNLAIVEYLIQHRVQPRQIGIEHRPSSVFLALRRSS
jgi:hypothetical protein